MRTIIISTPLVFLANKAYLPQAGFNRWHHLSHLIVVGENTPNNGEGKVAMLHCLEVD